MRNVDLTNWEVRQIKDLYYLVCTDYEGIDYKAPVETNEMGARIVRGLTEGRTYEEIAHDMSIEYDVPKENVRNDIDDFMNGLAETLGEK